MLCFPAVTMVNWRSWMLHVLVHQVPVVLPQQGILLDFKVDEDLHLPVVWLIAKILDIIFSCRMDKNPCTLFNTRATLEESIMLLHK